MRDPDVAGSRLPPVLPASSASLQRAVAALARGEVVAYPTETLYGLGALALDPAAIERLLVLKGRCHRQPISVLVRDHEMLLTVVAHIPAIAQGLIERYWPGPLTLVLPARHGLPVPLVNERGGIGVRISPDPVVRRLLALIAGPLTATSANPSGQAAATEARQARLPGVALVLDDGVRQGAPSTVVEVIDRPVILRRGAIALTDLEVDRP